ncbi:aromatic prenyltransferase [Pseudoneurospora amorphoporcata]|uniref:Aromatic prenyltransferase n=1 Tax=Pseudoneurospora amorphoporcata TaxID=241081 RepID=A0AAN6NL72_9PEZI|nr:aromatic prenyltransferase [Pseudoneurospora amorphoporcata]
MPSRELEYPKQPYSTVKRLNDRARYSLETIHAIINSSPFINVAFQDSTSPFPAVLPMIGQMGSFSRPSADLGDVLDLYLHGYVSSRLMNLARTSPSGEEGEEEGIPLTLTATLLDGYVLSLTPNSHSYNYRSAVLFGYATPVVDPAEKLWAMELVTNSVVPQRYQNTRTPPNNAEMQSTSILRVKIKAGSAKIRSGEPHDDRADMNDEELRQKAWVGVVPAWLQFGEPVAGGYNRVDKVPRYLDEWRVEGNEERRREAYEAVKEVVKPKKGDAPTMRQLASHRRTIRLSPLTLRRPACLPAPSSSSINSRIPIQARNNSSTSEPRISHQYDDTNPNHHYWWAACSPSLTSLLRHSHHSYTPTQQSVHLSWFRNNVIPNLGPRPSSSYRLRSPLNYEGSPYRPTWNFCSAPAGSSSSSPKVKGTLRFSFEPIPATGTSQQDPTNQERYRTLFPLLAGECHGHGKGETNAKADLTWYDEVKEHMYLTASEQTVLRSKLACVPGQLPLPPEHAAIAIGCLGDKRVLKPYFFAGPKSLVTGYEMRPGKEEPEVKVYLPLMHFFDTEEAVVEALEEVWTGFGWGAELGKGGYGEAMREAFPHVDFNKAPGTHTWVSFSYSDHTGPYMTVYLAPRFQEAYDLGVRGGR